VIRLWSHGDRPYGPEHSRFGAKGEKVLIVNRGFKSVVTLDIINRKTPNPDSNSGITTVKYLRPCERKKGPVDRVFTQ
jgi:hypothetical protein